MDETATPWRALETSPGGASGREPDARAPGWSSRQVASAGAVVVAGVLGLVALWLVAGGGRGSVFMEGDRPDPGASTARVAAAVAPGPVDRLVVDVQGALLRPGVVELPAGSRVGDAIAAAGGFGPRVATDRVARSLNLAALVRDGDQIVVPSRDDPVASSGGGGRGSSAAPPGGSGAGEPVDLNHASAEALDALPGVGPATAAKIIAAREEQPFASIDDLRARKIVGAATFEKLKTLVAVR
jgi:competence protein ComEA